ncbi:hypothetical protein JNUCC1_02715 [Lentibacillus sp. JNUCC-1]|nr:hypothetical protein [Lentibacillus sp. JNUCC-1]MUV38844.1 hypothetical protein [Lentibacillus sp. JNUCC-1]
MSFTTILVYLTLASLLFTINDVNKVKKENEKLRKDVEALKKQVE